MRDLIVAGGGPVGLATALYAARAGLDVEVREPRVGTVDKACGEGLMPSAVADLTALGVPLEGQPIAGIRYLDHRRVAEPCSGRDRSRRPSYDVCTRHSPRPSRRPASRSSTSRCST